MKDKTTLKWIAGNMKGKKAEYSIMLIMSVLQAASSVFMALAIKWIINAAVGNAQASVIIKYALILVGTVLFQFAAGFLMHFLRERIRLAAEVQCKTRVFSQTLKKDYAEISAYHSGDLLNRIFSDTSVVAGGIANILSSVTLMVTRLVCAFAVLVYLQPLFTLLLAGVGLFLFFFSLLFRKKMKRLHKTVQETDGRTRSFMQESLGNMLAVKVFGAEDSVSRRADGFADKYYAAGMKKEKLSIFANSGFSLAFGLGYAAALIWGAFGISKGTIDYGTLAAMLQLVSQVQAPFVNLSGIMPRYYAMLASAERLIEIESLTEEMQTACIGNSADFYKKLQAVEFDDVTFSYGRETILENACFSVVKGEFTVIKGISGIGKSTILKLMLGVYKCTGGDVRFVTDDGNIPAEKGLRGLFAYVPQGNQLFSGTVRENLCFVCETASETEINTALKNACAEFVFKLPDGLETTVGENGFGLSEGQVQRLAIARALLTEAPILLFDEATSALDAETEKQLLGNLTGIGNKTLVLVTHKTAASGLADKIIEISEKKVYSV